MQKHGAQEGQICINTLIKILWRVGVRFYLHRNRPSQVWQVNIEFQTIHVANLVLLLRVWTNLHNQEQLVGFVN